MIWCDGENENCATAPFLALFVWGFLYTSVMMVAKGWIERMRFCVRQAPPSEVCPAASGAHGF
jgi:hypothetical protein